MLRDDYSAGRPVGIGRVLGWAVGVPLWLMTFAVLMVGAAVAALAGAGAAAMRGEGEARMRADDDA